MEAPAVDSAQKREGIKDVDALVRATRAIRSMFISEELIQVIFASVGISGG
jgi:hypothetical protein